MPKKVLHVVNVSFVLPYFIGDQFDFFKMRGFEFYVACSPSTHLQEYSKIKAFKAYPINIVRKVSLIDDIKAINQVYRLIRKEKISIVIGHTPKGALVGMIASFLARVRSRIYFRHGLMYETSTGIKKSVFKFIEKFTGILATKVICVSKSILNKSLKDKLNSCNKMSILHDGTCNGVNINKFLKKNVSQSSIEELRTKYNIKKSVPVIGFVGRLVKDKGIHELVDAWKILNAKYPSAMLLLVGPIEERDSISEEAKNFIKSNASIVHTGLISETLPFYALMDIFVLPSYREGFPTVVLEASAMEIPVITSQATGCIDSIINGETGLFCSITGTSIASKIETYLSNSELRKQHGVQGRNFVVNHFKQETIWQEIELIFQTIV